MHDSSSTSWQARMLLGRHYAALGAFLCHHYIHWSLPLQSPREEYSPITSTSFISMSPAQETAAVQQQRAGTVAIAMGMWVYDKCGLHVIKATNNLPSATLLMGHQYSRQTTLSSSGKASPPCRETAALNHSSCDVSEVLSWMGLEAYRAKSPWTARKSDLGCIASAVSDL